VIKFQEIALKLCDRLGCEQDGRSLHAEIGGSSGLGFDEVAGKDCRGIVSFVSIDPDAALGVQNGSARLLGQVLSGTSQRQKG
jgi:hypothetical protein